MPKFNELKEEILSCLKCSELIKSRTQVVFGSGNEKSEILFIGEAPGANEDKQGLPFCGMSGKILNELLTSANLQRENIFITNTLLCRPPNNRNPAKDEIENCRERLNKLIETMQPKVMVTIGNFATERILGKTGIRSMHGKVYSFIFNGQEIKVVPVIHPASYLYSGRNPEMLAQMKADFKVISGLVKTGKQQKQLGEF